MSDIVFYNNGYIAAYFENAGTPQTGLTVSLDVYNVITGLKALDTVTMGEIGSGLYRYNFSSYDNTKIYAAVADGSSTLGTTDRYIVGYSEDVSILNNMKTSLDNLYLSLRDWMRKIELGKQ